MWTNCVVCEVTTEFETPLKKITGFKTLSFWVTKFLDCLKPSQLCAMNLSVCRTEHQHVDLLPAGHGTEPGTAPAVFSLRLSEGRQSTLGEVWKQKYKFLSLFSKIMWSAKCCLRNEFLQANDNTEHVIFNSVKRNHLINSVWIRKTN